MRNSCQIGGSSRVVPTARVGFGTNYSTTKVLLHPRFGLYANSSSRMKDADNSEREDVQRSKASTHSATGGRAGPEPWARRPRLSVSFCPLPRELAVALVETTVSPAHSRGSFEWHELLEDLSDVRCRSTARADRSPAEWRSSSSQNVEDKTLENWQPLHGQHCSPPRLTKCGSNSASVSPPSTHAMSAPPPGSDSCLRR